MQTVRRWPRVAAGLMLAILSTLTSFASALPAVAGSAAGEVGSTCLLGTPNGAVRHVIEIVFDNLDFARTNPNVPSDLEQMPNLEKFITSNGTLLSNEHAVLLGHAANNIITTLTGVYPDRQGIPIANGYRYYNANGTTSSASAFSYWTSPAGTGDPTPNMLAADGQNAPAPWVPFTRAGCNVGAIGVANMAIENLSTDVDTIFGPHSAQAQEVKDNPNQAQADFEAIAVHCAKDAALCSTADGGVADKLPDEPGGYDGYQALFGNVSIAPQVSPGGPVRDLYGDIIQSPSGNYGSPGFNGFSPANTLGYVADMQEHGVPVTYAYISTPKNAGGVDLGPGSAGYEAQLQSYNAAFGTFFSRLAHDDITPANTLFVFSSDEGGHFVGSDPTPANCDGVTTLCSYSQIGQIDLNLTALPDGRPAPLPFSVQAGMAPAFYIDGNPSSDSAETRAWEQAIGAMGVIDPYTGQMQKVTNYLAGREELAILHMTTADPARTPSFVAFNWPDYVSGAEPDNCDPSSSCVAIDPTSAWTHGTVSQDIDVTWAGFVGPGVKALGVDSSVWSDHTDIRPTMLALLGLHDDYTSDGRVLAEMFDPSALPSGIAANPEAYITLGSEYQQINAPLGAFGQQTLLISTAALESSPSDAATYSAGLAALATFGRARATLAGQMMQVLNAAALNGTPVTNDEAAAAVTVGQGLVTSTQQLANKLAPGSEGSLGW